MKRAPGPRRREILAAVLGRKRDPVRLIAELHERFGDTVRIPVGDTDQFLLGSVDGIKHVLVDHHRNYSKGPSYELLALILGNGLVTSEGEHWKRQRKLIRPIFQKEQMRIFSEIMADIVLEEVRALETLADNGRRVDVFSRMMDLALRIASRTVLGADMQGQERKVHDSFSIILHQIEKLSTSKIRLLELLPGGSRIRRLGKWLANVSTDERKQFLGAIETLNSLIAGVISQRRTEMSRTEIARSGAESKAPDLVTMLLQTKDESGQLAMSDAEIRDEVMTFFLAGHETTGAALTWTFYLLAKNPDYHRKIRMEVENVLQLRVPSLENLDSLRMCQWVFEESLRLYPPIWRLSRFAQAKDEIQGFSVPKGSVMVVTPYLIHRDPRYWEKPDVFDPERFSAERSSARPRLAYIPFGAGPRACVGTTFAMTEAQMILAVICRSIFFELAPDHQLVLQPRVLLRPQGGMPMSVHRVK